VAAVDAVAASGGDPAQLLHVEVDELPDPILLVADRGAGGPVGVVQAGQAVAAEDPVHRGPGHPQLRTEPVRSPLQAATNGQDLADLGRWQGVGAAAGPGRAVLEPRLSLLPVAAEPLVDRRSGHPGSLGGLPGHPAQDRHPLHQQKPPLRRQLRPTMGHESLLSAGVHTPTVMEALAVSTTLVGTTASPGERVTMCESSNDQGWGLWRPGTGTMRDLGNVPSVASVRRREAA
jgi:hypothetical protein